MVPTPMIHKSYTQEGGIRNGGIRGRLQTIFPQNVIVTFRGRGLAFFFFFFASTYGRVASRPAVNLEILYDLKPVRKSIQNS